MTETYFPFDAGNGAAIIESQWADMACLWARSGVNYMSFGDSINKLAVTASGSNMNVSIDSGRAWVRGFGYKNDASASKTLSAAHATLNRIDRIVIRLDRTANTVLLAVLTGTNGASPSAPALTQNSTTWEISLAQVYIGAAVTTISNSNITDERELTFPGVGIIPGRELEVKTSNPPFSGITSSKMEAWESGGAGTAKPVAHFIRLEKAGSPAENGRMWDWTVREYVFGTPILKLRGRMSGANTSKAVRIAAYCAKIRVNDTSVQNVVFDTVNASNLSVNDTANKEFELTLTLTNFASWRYGDKAILLVTRVANNAGDTASGDLLVDSVEVLYG